MVDDDIKLLKERIRSGGQESVLASLFRSIIFDLGIGIERFNVLVERYMVRAHLPTNLKEASSVRGNLRKELLKPSMSWKVFIKGLKFLNIKKFDLNVTLYHASGRTTEHSKVVILDPTAGETEEDE